MKIMDIIYIPFGYVMKFFCSFTNNNYAISLLLFALLMKIVLLPFSIKQQKNQIKGAALRPKMMAIEKKYAGRNDKATLQKKQNEIMELQQKEGYSPLSGCLPLLIQFPIIIGLYNIIRNPLTYVARFASETTKALAEKVNSLAEGTFANVDKVDQITLISKIKELGYENFSSVEGFSADLLPNFNMFGLDISATPQIASWLVIIPILVFASQFLSMKLSRKFNPVMQATVTKEAQMSNNMMDIMMPLMTLWMSFNLSATLGIYWIYQSIIGLAQMFILAKLMPIPQMSEEELRQAEKELKVKQQKNNASSDKPKVRSLHHIDDDDEDIPAPAPKQAPKKNSSIAPAPVKDESDKNASTEAEKDNASAENSDEEKDN
jgi:YidC/Oxa1 family membrane protein insertase